MLRALGFPALCLLLGLHAAGCFSGNNNHILAIHHKRSGKPAFLYHHSQDIEKNLDIATQKIYKHSSSETQINKNHQIVKSAFLRPAYDPSLNLLAVAGQDLEVENLPIPAANVIVVGNVGARGVMLYALLKCFFHLLNCLVSCAIVSTLRTTSYSTVSSSFNLTPLGFCGFPNWKEEEKKGVKKVNW